MSTNPGRTLASYETPGYRQQQVAQFAALLAGLGQRYRERQEAKRQKEEAELDFFFKATQAYPEVASSPYAEQVRAKWAEKRPDVVAVIEAISNRAALKKQAEGSLDRYYGALEQVEGDYARWEDAAQGPPLIHPFGLPGGIPNQEAISAQQQLQQTPRATLPLMAAQRLSPKERAAARIEAKRQGLVLPEDPDPFADLPADAKTLLMGQMGLLEGEPVDVVRYKTGMKSSPADIEYREWATAEEGRRGERESRQQEHEREERRAREAHDIKMEGARHSHRMQAIAASKDEADEERGITPKPAAAAKELAELANDAYEEEYKEWSDGLATAAKTGSTSKAKAQSRTDYLKTRPKPKRVPPSVARRVIARIEQGIEQGAISPEDGDLLATEYMGRVMAAMARGKTAEQALREEDPGAQ